MRRPRDHAGGVTDNEGATPCDVIVSAAAYNNKFCGEEITGRGGVKLANAGARRRRDLGITVQAFRTCSVDGPSTNLAHAGSIIFHSECQVRYAGAAGSSCSRAARMRHDVNGGEKRLQREAANAREMAGRTGHDHRTRTQGASGRTSPWRLVTMALDARANSRTTAELSGLRGPRRREALGAGRAGPTRTTPEREAPGRRAEKPWARPPNLAVEPVGEHEAAGRVSPSRRDQEQQERVVSGGGSSSARPPPSSRSARRAPASCRSTKMTRCRRGAATASREVRATRARAPSPPTHRARLGDRSRWARAATRTVRTERSSVGPARHQTRWEGAGGGQAAECAPASRLLRSHSTTGSPEVDWSEQVDAAELARPRILENRRASRPRTALHRTSRGEPPASVNPRMWPSRRAASRSARSPRADSRLGSARRGARAAPARSTGSLLRRAAALRHGNRSARA